MFNISKYKLIDHIPKLHPSKYVIFGMEISEKTWIYFLSLQLMFSDGLYSITASLIGL
jgi:hypothetical protein